MVKRELRAGLIHYPVTLNEVDNQQLAGFRHFHRCHGFRHFFDMCFACHYCSSRQTVSVVADAVEYLPNDMLVMSLLIVTVPLDSGM